MTCWFGPSTAALRRIDCPGPYYMKCGVMLAELCSVGAGQADVFDTRDTDRRRLMTALDAINRRVGRDSLFYAGAGIHRDRKTFAAPVMLILPERRHIRSGSLANTRAQPGLAERIRFVGNRLEPSLPLRENGGTAEPPPFSTARGTSSDHRHRSPGLTRTDRSGQRAGGPAAPAPEATIMASSESVPHGSVVGLWRYPVKSMRGEELDVAEITARGVLGDRAYALIDAETGRVVSAKNPRKWPNLFEFRSEVTEFRAEVTEPTPASGPIPPARITLPDGATAATDEPGVEERLSAWVGRPVRLGAAPPEAPRIEGYWPEYDWLESPDAVFEVKLPPGTYFDCASIHIIATATLDRLRALAPQSRFDVRRFRPNLVIETAGGAEGFVENDWIGRTLAVGDEVRLRVSGPCPRCVMTTLSQGDLPKDPNVLRTAVQNNQGNVGVYAAVLRGGRIRRGDAVAVE
jgi:uncharacterized protein YcbX